MVQVAGSSAFCGAATAFICMGDSVLDFLSGICALAWAATTSELRSLRLPSGQIVRRL